MVVIMVVIVVVVMVVIVVVLVIVIVVMVVIVVVINNRRHCTLNKRISHFQRMLIIVDADYCRCTLFGHTLGMPLSAALIVPY